jgi:hypothetical protein
VVAPPGGARWGAPGHFHDQEKNFMCEQRINAEAILETLTRVRTMIPRPLVPVPPAAEEWPAPATMNGDPMENFEYQAVMDGLTTVAEELRATIAAAEATVLDDCLRVYFAAADLARDPAHAHLTAHVEAMRAAYERDFGRAIPTREEWEGGGNPASE